MSGWKIAGGGLAAAGLLAAAVAVAHHARAEESVAGAASPHAAQAHGAAQGAHADPAELHRQMVALAGAVLAETDFEAVSDFVVGVARAHAAEIGEDPDVLAYHVETAMGHVAYIIQEHPEEAAQGIAGELMDIALHAPADTATNAE